MKVLGIDPGTAACGFGIVHASGGRLRAVEYGWWETSPKDAPQVRLKQIHDEVAALIARHEPGAVALEGIVRRRRRPHRALRRAGARRRARRCAAAEVECSEYAPASVKRAVCGYGHAEKDSMQRMVKAVLGLAEVLAASRRRRARRGDLPRALAPPLVALAGGR